MGFAVRVANGLKTYFGGSPHPLASKSLKGPESRLTRVITGENQSGAGDLLLVCFNHHWTF